MNIITDCPVLKGINTSVAINTHNSEIKRAIEMFTKKRISVDSCDSCKKKDRPKIFVAYFKA